MSIPTYEDIMLPFLKYISDGQEHSFRDIVDFLAKEFNLSEEEKKELLPSGQQAVFDNRAGWAKTHLKKSGLLYYPKRGFSKITDKGLNALTQNLEKIDNKYLMQFPEFKEFFKPSNSQNEKVEEISCTTNNNKTSEETIEYLIEDIEQQLADELLDTIKNSSPAFFERLVVELLLKMGYGSSRQDILQNTGKSGDEGIDGIIKEDVLGLDKIYIQAKRWQGTIGRPKIQEFVGAIDNKTHKGVFITTSCFSAEAKEYAAGKPSIVLIDGMKLTELMIKYNLGVSVKQSYEVKKIDEDFFID